MYSFRLALLYNDRLNPNSSASRTELHLCTSQVTPVLASSQQLIQSQQKFGGLW